MKKLFSINGNNILDVLQRYCCAENPARFTLDYLKNLNIPPYLRVRRIEIRKVKDLLLKGIVLAMNLQLSSKNWDLLEANQLQEEHIINQPDNLPSQEYHSVQVNNAIFIDASLHVTCQNTWGTNRPNHGLF